MRDFGTVRPGTTLYIPFATYDSNDPSASVTLTGLATTDIEIYRDGSTTQRSSDAGFTLLDTDGIDFDGVTGIHGISISLADNSDAGFYRAGSQYTVVVASVTVDAGTINFIAATFRIGHPSAILNTSIATLASQTSFTLTDGPAEDDALNGMWAVIHDVASAVQWSKVLISDYTGSTKTVTLAAGATFTAAAADNFSVIDLAPVQPTVTGRTLDVSATGEADANMVQIGGDTQSATDLKDFADAGYDPATNKVQGVVLTDTLTTYTGNTVQTGDSYAIVNSGTHGNAALKTLIDAVDTVVDAILVDTGTTLQTELDGIQADTEDIQTRLPAALTANGNMKSSLLEIITTALTEGAAGRIAAAWQGFWNVASPVATATSVNQAGDSYAVVSSGTHGNAALKTLIDAVDTVVDTILVDTSELQTDWVNGGRLDLILDATATTTELNKVPKSDGTTTWNATAAAQLQSEANDALTAFWTSPATLVDLVWDEATSGHATAGTTGKALTDAGSAGDPWSTAVPGAYSAGSAGYILGTNLDAAISSRMATYTQPTGFLAATFPTTVASTTNITAASGVTISGTTMTLDALQTAQNSAHGAGSWATATGFSTHSAADVWASATRTLTAFGFTVTTANAADVTAILADTTELQTDWANGGRLDLILDARATEASVMVLNGVAISTTGNVGVGSTTTVIVTDLAIPENSYPDHLMVFTSGNVAGRSSPILSVTTGGVVTLAEAIHAAPNNGVAFAITPMHVHPVSQIQSGLATQASVDTIDGIVDAILVDTGTTLQTELDGIQADTEDIQSRIPAALVGGRMDSSTGAMAANVLTASALATDAVTEIQSGLATLANQVILIDGQGFGLAMLTGTISDAGTAAESYATSYNGSTYTVDFTGLDATGNRGGATRTKT